MLGALRLVWGLSQLYGYAVFQPFLVCIDRFFLQSGALFRLFGHDTSGLSVSMADQEGGDSLL